MYSYFKGKITEIYATHITVEVADIGYTVKVPNPYFFTLDSLICIYIHQHIKEDANELYGFATLNEKLMFEKLISVKGLGPKGALAILASTTPNEINQAINEANVKFFNSFPGIGAKISQQIILDLKGKLTFLEEENKDTRSEIIEQVSLALKSLGYTNAEIKNVTKNLSINDNISLSDAVKMALKMIKH